MNHDNDLNLHLHDQMSGWLRYCTWLGQKSRKPLNLQLFAGKVFLFQFKFAQILFKFLAQVRAALSQSEEISSDLCCFYGEVCISHNKDIYEFFLKDSLLLSHSQLPFPLKTRIRKISCGSTEFESELESEVESIFRYPLLKTVSEHSATSWNKS